MRTPLGACGRSVVKAKSTFIAKTHMFYSFDFPRVPWGTLGYLGGTLGYLGGTLGVPWGYLGGGPGEEPVILALLSFVKTVRVVLALRMI